MIPAHLDAFWGPPRLATLKVRHVTRTGRTRLAEHTDTVVAAARAAHLDRFGQPESGGHCVLVLTPERVRFGD